MCYYNVFVNTHALILIVSYQNSLWVLCLDCTRGYLHFDMLVAMVSVRNNDTCLFGMCCAGDYGTSIKRNLYHSLPRYQMSTLVIMFTK